MTEAKAPQGSALGKSCGVGRDESSRAIPVWTRRDARLRGCVNMRRHSSSHAAPQRQARSINHDARRQAQGLVSAPWCVPCPWFPDCSLLLSFLCQRESFRGTQRYSLWPVHRPVLSDTSLPSRLACLLPECFTHSYGSRLLCRLRICRGLSRCASTTARSERVIG